MGAPSKGRLNKEPDPGLIPDIPLLFLCHSSKDKPFVRQLAQDLSELSVYVWFDDWELAPGDSLHEKIGDALDTSAFVGVVLSPDSVNSKWCKKELHQALSRETRTSTKVILPLLYRNVTAPPFLEDKLILDFSNDYYSAITRLVSYICGLNQRIVSDTLVASVPKDLAGTKKILRKAGWRSNITISSKVYDAIRKLLEKEGIKLHPEQFALFETPRATTFRIMTR